MKKLFNRKSITAFFFISFLFVFAYKNLETAYLPIKQALQNAKEKELSLSQTLLNLENTMNDNIYKRYDFIETYGYLQDLMYKDEIANFEVVRDEQGALHYTYFAQGPHNTDKLVKRISTLNKTLQEKNIQVAYIMPPDKYIRGYTQLPKGIPYHYNNETADDFLIGLEDEGIKTLDLRDTIPESGISPEALFFKTDHHWTIQTAFWGFQELVKWLEETYKIALDPEGFYTNKAYYHFITYEDSFIGSMGRKTGVDYSGIDDFTVVYPKFDTQYSVQMSTEKGNEKLQGRFEEVLFSPEAFMQEGNKYETDKYFAYLRGNLPFVHIINEACTTGPKALFIKDSMSIPLITFLSTVFSEIYVVDPRYYAEDIPTLAAKLPLDFVFLSVYPPNLTEEFFPFYQEE